MSDITSTGPDNGYIEQNIKPTSHYERILGKEYPVESKEIGGVIIDTKKGVITIVQKAETKKETNELNNEILRKIEVKLSSEEIEVVGGKIIAFFKGEELIKYEIGDKYLIDVKNFDVNNDFGNLLSRKVSNLYFSRGEDGKLKVNMGDGRIYKQNENMFHRAFYLQFGRIKEPIKK